MQLPHMRNLIVQYMKDYDASFRILEEPLMLTGIGVAFAKDDDRGICEQMEPDSGRNASGWHIPENY